jgi:hypothetical protein
MRAFRLLKLALLAACAWQVGGIAAALLGHRLLPLPEASPPWPSGPAAAARRSPPRAPVRFALLDPAPAPAAAPSATPRAHRSEPAASAEPTGCADALDGEAGSLVATVVAAPPAAALAVVALRDGARRVVGEGDTLDGAVIARISRGALLLRRGEACVRLRLDDGAPDARAGVAPAVPAPAGGEPPLRRDGEHVELPAALLAEVMADPMKLAGGARVVPHFAGGRGQGFRLLSVRPGSLVARAGLRNGDVLRGVAGVALTGPDAALEAWSRVREAREVEVELERGGRPLRLRSPLR